MGLVPVFCARQLNCIQVNQAGEGNFVLRGGLQNGASQVNYFSD